MGNSAPASPGNNEEIFFIVEALEIKNKAIENYKKLFAIIIRNPQPKSYKYIFNLFEKILLRFIITFLRLFL